MEQGAAQRRVYPRILAEFPIQITLEFIGTTVDVSEAGLKFILQKPLLLSKAKAKIQLSAEESIDAEFKVIWNKQLVTDGKFTYGACFVRLKEKNLRDLRAMLINSTAEHILKKVTDKNFRERILHFWKDDFEKYLEGLTRISKSLDEKTISKEEACREINDINEEIMKKGGLLAIDVDNKVIINRIKEKFRAISGPWVYKSSVVRRAFEKPRGYPGDYKLIETIYNNEAISEGIGYCYDRYFLSNAYAVAVRNREIKMQELLLDFIEETGSSKINILNLACGSCREIKEAFIDSHRNFNKSICFNLVDQDVEALEFSKKALKSDSKKLSLSFFNQNILEYLKDGDKHSKVLGKQHLIYTIGLADYLPDRILKKLLAFCFSILENRGRLIVAHKDISEYKPLPANWWCDWEFYSRDENDMLDLISKSEMKNFNIRIEREKSGVILFLIIDRIL